MPEDFMECARKGGKIRTKHMGKGKYAHVCILNGKTHMGEIKDKKSAKQ